MANPNRQQRQADDLEALNVRWWDELAPEWAARPVPDAADLVAHLIADLNCPPGSFLLDAGCGAGALSVPLAQHGYHVQGIDLSPAQIALARQRAHELGEETSRLRFEVGDLERLPLPDDAVDGILCWLTLDFVPRPGVTLGEFRRVLKSGGRLVLSILGAYSAVRFDPGHERWRRFLPDPPPMIPLNDILPWEVEALLGALGWKIVEQYPRLGRTLRGPARSYTEEQIWQLPDHILRQAAASVWVFVAANL